MRTSASLTDAPDLDLARFGIKPEPVPETAGRGRKIAIWLGLFVAVAVWLLPTSSPDTNIVVTSVGMLVVIVALLLPDRAALVARRALRLLVTW